MSPPRYSVPTRPCPRCSCVVPVRRYEASTLRMLKRRPYEEATFVNRCGHDQEFVLVPERDGWFGQILVLGEAR